MSAYERPAIIRVTDGTGVELPLFQPLAFVVVLAVDVVTWGIAVYEAGKHKLSVTTRPYGLSVTHVDGTDSASQAATDSAPATLSSPVLPRVVSLPALVPAVPPAQPLPLLRVIGSIA